MTNKLPALLLASTFALLSGCLPGDENDAPRTPASYTVGGTLDTAPDGLRLSLNNRHTLSPNGANSFRFEQPLADGTRYEVGIASQPESGWCSVSNASGTISGADVDSVTVNCAQERIQPSVNVTGLNGQLEVQLNGGEQRRISSNGTHTFNTVLADGAPANFVIISQPSGQSCELEGHIITCSSSYTIGGTAANIPSGGITLRLDNGDTVQLSTDGSFRFPNRVAEDTSYNVRIHGSVPGDYACDISNATGTVSGGDITDIHVSCAIPTYSVGVTVSGLDGELELHLLANGQENERLSLSSNGDFQFPTELRNNTTFTVSLASAPESQSCRINGQDSYTGTIQGSDYSNISVVCETLYKYQIEVLGFSGNGLSVTAGDETATFGGSGTWTSGQFYPEGSSEPELVSATVPAEYACYGPLATGEPPLSFQFTCLHELQVEVEAGSGQFVVSWNDGDFPNDAPNNAPNNATYVVEVQPFGSDCGNLSSLDADSSPFEVKHLQDEETPIKNGCTYEVTVRVYFNGYQREAGPLEVSPQVVWSFNNGSSGVNQPGAVKGMAVQKVGETIYGFGGSEYNAGGDELAYTAALRQLTANLSWSAVAADGTPPSPRAYATSWSGEDPRRTDSTFLLVLFGGEATNDVHIYRPTASNYVARGWHTVESNNGPSSVTAAANWSQGSAGPHWFFGGHNEYGGLQADLWRLGVTRSARSGSYGVNWTQSEPQNDDTPWPTARSGAATWTDDDNFWLFGGYVGGNYSNELWQLDVSNANNPRWHLHNQEAHADSDTQPAPAPTPPPGPMARAISGSSAAKRATGST
ncbi:hypothetical protein CAI21_21265 [Alkalilimnicola ehrlichii]|nr:kelch repeat-containing protein [Alkalilimnicola ehrlichii]RFA24522.1 hypothetical protein CAI21_21265 [Alkalilimnicola ehrlichii]